MKNFFKVVVINIFALFIISNIVAGIEISSWQTLVVSAIVLTFINLFIKPIVKLIMLPVNVLTLGLFTLFINAFLLSLVKIVKGFYIQSFSSAFIGAILLSIIYLVVENFVITSNYKKFRKSNYSDSKTINDNNVIDVEGKYEKDDKSKNGNL